MKQINTKEDLFFSDVADKSLLEQFFDKLYGQNASMFFRRTNKIIREQQNSEYTLTTELGVFKTIQQARDYFNIQTDSLDEIRVQARNWNQEHQILSESVIKDLNGNTKLVLLNCAESICERFGGRCNEDDGCSTINFAKEYSNKKPFPIKVVVG